MILVSLALGSIVATLAILVKKELWLIIVGGIFAAETLSVIIQTSYFKYTRKKYGEGRRVFFNGTFFITILRKKGITEPKVRNPFFGLLVCSYYSLQLQLLKRNNMKKMTILGLGRSGLAAAILAKKNHYDVLVSDMKKFDKNSASIKILNDNNISYENRATF